MLFLPVESLIKFKINLIRSLSLRSCHAELPVNVPAGAIGPGRLHPYRWRSRQPVDRANVRGYLQQSEKFQR